jgi:hypothetical protein
VQYTLPEVCAAYTGVAWISAPAAVAAAAAAVVAAAVAAAAVVAAAVAAAAAAAAASAEWGQTAVTVEPGGWPPYAGGSVSVAAHPSTAEKDSQGEKDIYEPMIYATLHIMLLMRANPLRGQVKRGWALKSRLFWAL